MIKKGLTALIAAIFVLTALTGLSVSAYDVDFSIKPQEPSAKQGDSITVNVVITTQDKGYTAFEMQLLYDESVFSCESQYNDNGYVGSGKNGVYSLIYEDPSIDEPSPTKSGDAITIPVKFTVLSDAALGETKFNASVISCTGVNNLDLNSPVKLELAQLLSKTVKIDEGEPNIDDTGIDDTTSDEPSVGDDIGEKIDQPTLPNNNDNSINWIEIVGIIIGGIVVFFSGCVVGYLFKQKQTDSAREDYYSSRRHHSSDNDSIDINDSSSAYAGINGISNNNEPTQGNRNYGTQPSASLAGSQPYSAPVSIGNEKTFSGYSATINSYSTGYKQAPMQTSYATGALQTSTSNQPAASYINNNNTNNNNNNINTQISNPFSAVAPKTFTTGNNPQTANSQWQANQGYSTQQPSTNPFTAPAQAQPASSFSVQNSQPAVTASFSGVQSTQNNIEMAYRGEGTVGTYRPTPPAQGAYAPAYTQFGQNQTPQGAGTSQTASTYQPTAQKTQPPTFKTEYTIGRSGYGIGVNPTQPQQNYSTNPQTGSYLQQQGGGNQTNTQQSAQPQATVQNRFLTGNPQQINNGFNNNTYRR